MADIAKSGAGYDLYTGATRTENDPVEAAAPTPGSYLTQLSPDERRLWDNLFKLYKNISIFIYLTDIVAGEEIPPAYLDTPWHFISDDISYVQPNYAALRSDYLETGRKLIEEYQKLRDEAPNLGIGVVVLGLIVTLVTISGAILFKYGGPFVESLKKDTETLRIEAITDRLKIYNEMAVVAVANGADWNEILKDLNESAKKVAEDIETSWPFKIKQAIDLIKWIAISGGLFLIWKIIR